MLSFLQTPPFGVVLLLKSKLYIVQVVTKYTIEGERLDQKELSKELKGKSIGFKRYGHELKEGVIMLKANYISSWFYRYSRRISLQL